MVRRLSIFHHYLRALRAQGERTVSSTRIAEALGYTPILVRKDLQCTGLAGRPKTGYIIDELLQAINAFIGWSEQRAAVLFGAGNLGRALLNYPWLADHGLRFEAAFDVDRARVHDVINRIPVFPIARFDRYMKTHAIDIGVITVPAHAAQATADRMAARGIAGIWNFSNVHLTVPAGVILENADFTLSLATLTRRLKESHTSARHRT
jgi:redox-sensing transcriptional repressor